MLFRGSVKIKMLQAAKCAYPPDLYLCTDQLYGRFKPEIFNIDVEQTNNRGCSGMGNPNRPIFTWYF